MTKERIYTITPEQLLGFTKSEDGGLVIPDSFEVYIVPTAEDLRAQRVAELEAQLATLTEPTEEQLIQEGKMTHPYYMLVDELIMLKSE